MESKNDLILKGNLDEVGRKFLSKGVAFALVEKFSLASEFIKEGLYMISCDCKKGEWLKEYKSTKRIFANVNNLSCTNEEYYLTKSFLMSYSECEQDLYVALDAVENYIATEKDEYGYYIKCKILCNLKRFEDALLALEEGNSQIPFEQLYDCGHLYKYKKGRILLHQNKRDGIIDIFDSFLLNKSSSCCVRALKAAIRKWDIRLQTSENDLNNQLIFSFVSNENDVDFQNLYEKTFSENQTSIIEEFIRFLINNRGSLNRHTVKPYYNRSNNQYPSRRELERESFDALTDGQYGDYNDWDGDIDSVRDWMGS